MGERPGPWVPRAIAVAVGTASTSGVASAHEVVGSRFEAPLPMPMLYAGAGATVALTALWLAWAEHADAPTDRGARVLSIPARVAAPFRSLVRGLFLAATVAVVALGLFGRQVPAENVATVFTWPVWFRGLALFAVLFGTPWRVLSPWRTVYRGLVRLEGRSIAVFDAPPFGAWPAVVGFVVLFGIAETQTVLPQSPRLTAVLVACYAFVMIGGAILFGKPWFETADPLEVLYRLFGRVAPCDAERTANGGYSVHVRPPWRGCFEPVRSVSLVVFVVATVYTVSFDGFTNTRQFRTVLFDVRDALGLGPRAGVALYVVGFLAFVGAFAVACWAVDRLGAPEARGWRRATRRFAPTVLPIAAGYEVAHNYPYVSRNLGQVLALLGRPLFPGIGPIEPLGWLSVPLFWGSQVAFIVLGHVVAVVAAHHVAVDRYESLAAARRGHVPLVLLMVGYTVLSLWIVSQPVVSG